MVKMVFEVSEQEFAEIVKQLSSRLREKDEDSENNENVLEDLRHPAILVVDFLQRFMIDMENENLLGHYDYELRVGGLSIPLDDPLGDKMLRPLVAKALASL